MLTSTSTSSLSPIKRRIVWGLRIVLALVFGAAGLSKLAGAEQMLLVFDAIGVGHWFRYLTGVVEILGAVLLVVPATGFVAAALLLATMLGAIATHLFVIGGSFVPALILAHLCGWLVWTLRPTSA